MENAGDNIREEMLKAAFQEVLAQERAAAQAQSELTSITAELKIKIGYAEKAQEAAWAQIAEMMKETGEWQVIIPSEELDYKISYSALRKSVKANADAAPDEYVKIERKPKMKEIKELLESGQQVNWASFEESAPKLQWKAIKKS